MYRCTLVCLILVVTFGSPVLCDGERSPLERSQSLTVAEQLKEILRQLVSSADQFTSLDSSLMDDFFGNVSQKCLNDTSSFFTHLIDTNRSRAEWAWKMLESSGRLPPSGLIGEANLHSEGLFDECLAIRGPENAFSGQYCTVFFTPEPIDATSIIDDFGNQSESATHSVISYLIDAVGIQETLHVDLTRRLREPKISKPDSFLSGLSPSISLCLPSSCSTDDLARSLARMIGTVIVANQSLVTLADERLCIKDTSSDPLPFDGPDIAVIVTLSLLALIVLVATARETWRTYCNSSYDFRKDGIALRSLHCFSALANGRKLLSMMPGSTECLNCLHGIRVLSTLWVVIGHTWYKGALSNSMNPLMLFEEGKSWWFQGISNATVSVDTFFLMSGLLVSYLLLKELDRSKGRFNVGLFYLHRYIRLTPVYAIVMGFIATLMVYIGTGPNWYNVLVASQSCRVAWWKQLLFINNLFQTHNDLQCMGETWYLAVDMQLFLISPIFVYLLWRWKRTGLIVLAGFTLASLSANFAVYFYFNLPPTLMVTRLNEMMTSSLNYLDYYYFKTWTRAPPYLIGILMGWILHSTNRARFHLHKGLVALFWIHSCAIWLTVIYGLYPYVDEVEIPRINDAISMTYGPLHRTAWALALSWVIFACAHGYGGFVGDFLSWKGFLPLSRLTYCVYLIHLDYLNVFYAWSRKPLYYTFIGQLNDFFGIAVSVFGLAFIVSLTVEAPFMNLEKLFFHSRTTAGEELLATAEENSAVIKASGRGDKATTTSHGRTNDGFNADAEHP